MGGERWLMLKSVKEAERLKAFLEPLDGEFDAGNGNGVWFSWHGKQRFEVGYQAHVFCIVVADLVSREVCKRFGVKRIGADSVGWYSDSFWKSDHERGAKSRYGPYKNWVAWMTGYRKEYSHRLFQPFEYYNQEEWNALENPVVAAFEKLDGAA